MRMFNWRVLLPAALASLALGAAGTLADSGPQQPSNDAQASLTPAPAPKPTVVYTRYIRPARVLHLKTHFTPWSEPTVAQVHQIIDIESARAHISSIGLTNRIRCESGFSWSVPNGKYVGLGQFANETFYRGMGSIGSRIVRYVSTRWRALRVVRIQRYSDGTIEHKPRWRVRQRIIHIHIGVIPRYPPRTHGWAQVRIMSEAIANRSAVHNSEWSCST